MGKREKDTISCESILTYVDAFTKYFDISLIIFVLVKFETNLKISIKIKNILQYITVYFKQVIIQFVILSLSSKNYNI